MDDRLQTPALLDVEPKGAQLPPGLERPGAADDDRIRVRLRNLKDQEKNKQITNFPC